MLFGQPGAGRKTLIENIKNNKEDINENLGLTGKKISFLDLPYDRDFNIFSYGVHKGRKGNISIY